MSYRDIYAGLAISSSTHNGRSHAFVEGQDDNFSPEEKITWAMLKHAVEETKILCRYGLITRQGELREWPMVRKRDVRKPDTWQREPMTIATMRDPLDHARLREFWNDPTQAQVWCDLCGCKLPAKDIWKSILENHAK